MNIDNPEQWLYIRHYCKSIVVVDDLFLAFKRLRESRLKSKFSQSVPALYLCEQRQQIVTDECQKRLFGVLRENLRVCQLRHSIDQIEKLRKIDRRNQIRLSFET